MSDVTNRLNNNMNCSMVNAEIGVAAIVKFDYMLETPVFWNYYGKNYT